MTWNKHSTTRISFKTIPHICICQTAQQRANTQNLSFVFLQRKLDPHHLFWYTCFFSIYYQGTLVWHELPHSHDTSFFGNETFVLPEHQRNQTQQNIASANKKVSKRHVVFPVTTTNNFICIDSIVELCWCKPTLQRQKERKPEIKTQFNMLN